MNNIAEILMSELNERKNINSSYSLRSFARFLDVSPATLSQAISDKRSLSKKMESKILDKLGYSPEIPKKSFSKKKQSLELDEDIFQFISHWHYYAILSLGELGVKAEPSEISKKLGISREMANQAITRLKRLGIIEINPDRTFKQVSLPLKTKKEISSKAIRKYHKDILDLAKFKIDEIDISKREYKAITLAGNSKNIKKARKLIDELKDLVVESMESGKSDEVFQLNIQLFPISNGDQNE